MRQAAVKRLANEGKFYDTLSTLTSRTVSTYSKKIGLLMIVPIKKYNIYLFYMEKCPMCSKHKNKLRIKYYLQIVKYYLQVSAHNVFK